ncbi:MAG: MBL fold metallo-hydrolase [Chitinophagaceae bacterium]|nr:MBL fold metallo-hydrolase [Chitinophagaceae bacterium]
MKITIRGVRGSIPTSGPATQKYGGNTSCIEVSAEGWQLVLDGGSGMRNSNTQERPLNNRLDILLTHLHMDHIQGLGFFKPFFDPEMEVHIWGPAGSRKSLHARLSKYLSPPLFPMYIRELPCQLILHEVDKSEFEIGPFRVQSQYVIHPGPTVGFRINDGKKTFTYIPDHEPALGIHGIVSDQKWISGFDLASNADLLIHDAQYTTAEYKERTGWGHSSMDDALKFASMACVKHLLMAHHDPNHTDTYLGELLTELKMRNNYSFHFDLAEEGMIIEL